jgi:sirohydrochlorin cobaltochelatase
MGKTALILAGHGSHISPETAGLVWRNVDWLRASGVADEITAAFWKETPSFHEVINSLNANDITIVPLFTAQGYFTQTVIPAEMGLDGLVTTRDGRTIRYTRTLNEDKYFTHVIQNRIWTMIRSWNLPLQETAVAIIGHSTRRNPESRQATETQADTLRKTGIVAEVVAVYLDDAPEIEQVYKLTSARHLIAVPYFLALGSHVTIDIPKELGLKPGEYTGNIEGRSVMRVHPCV